MSTTMAARGAFGAAPGVPDKILGRKMAGAVVVDKIMAPPGPGVFSTTTAPAILRPRVLSGIRGRLHKPPGGGGGYISGPHISFPYSLFVEQCSVATAASVFAGRSSCSGEDPGREG